MPDLKDKLKGTEWKLPQAKTTAMEPINFSGLQIELFSGGYEGYKACIFFWGEFRRLLERKHISDQEAALMERVRIPLSPPAGRPQKRAPNAMQHCWGDLKIELRIEFVESWVWSVFFFGLWDIYFCV